jgi:hypothetical protein
MHDAHKEWRAEEMTKRQKKSESEGRRSGVKEVQDQNVCVCKKVRREKKKTVRAMQKRITHVTKQLGQLSQRPLDPLYILVSLLHLPVRGARLSESVRVHELL